MTVCGDGMAEAWCSSFGDEFAAEPRSYGREVVDAHESRNSYGSRKVSHFVQWVLSCVLYVDKKRVGFSVEVWFRRPV